MSDTAQINQGDVPMNREPGGDQSIAEPRRSADWRDGFYDPYKDMLSKPARPGAEDALAIPSIINGKRTPYRKEQLCALCEKSEKVVGKLNSLTQTGGACDSCVALSLRLLEGRI